MPTTTTTSDSAEALVSHLAAARLRLERIAALAAGWDDEGATGPVAPYSWETVGRIAIDYARAGLSESR